MATLNLAAPAPLTEKHDLAGFCSGIAPLDEWLVRRAWNNQRSGASRTYVVAAGKQVVAYYCLASGALALGEAPGGMQRKMPDPIPMAILGRLAVDRHWQGRGLGIALLRDAVAQTQAASTILGIRGLLVHAISPRGGGFLRATWLQRLGLAATDPGPIAEAEKG